jgi:hypothetical protein
VEVVAGNFDDFSCFWGDESEFVLAGGDDLLAVLREGEGGGGQVEVVAGEEI